MSDHQKGWTEQDIAVAREIYVYNKASNMPERAICRLIAQCIRRGESTVRSRLRLRGPSFSDSPKRQQYRPGRYIKTELHHYVKIEDRPADHMLEDRDRRANLLPTSTTALICGDPLPGRSALDQKLSVNK